LVPLDRRHRDDCTAYLSRTLTIPEIFVGRACTARQAPYRGALHRLE